MNNSYLHQWNQLNCITYGKTWPNVVNVKVSILSLYCSTSTDMQKSIGVTADIQTYNNEWE